MLRSVQAVQVRALQPVSAHDERVHGEEGHRGVGRGSSGRLGGAVALGLLLLLLAGLLLLLLLLRREERNAQPDQEREVDIVLAEVDAQLAGEGVPGTGRRRGGHGCRGGTVSWENVAEALLGGSCASCLKDVSSWASTQYKLQTFHKRTRHHQSQ